jgi:hypothetical protein
MNGTLINTRTTITQTANYLGIFTWYQKCRNYLLFWIKQVPNIVDGVEFIEGELGYKVETITDEFYLNSNGELIVYSSNVGQYNIDVDGYLTTDRDTCGNLI